MNIISRKRKILALFMASLFFCHALAVLGAENGEMLTVRVGEDQGVRDISREYLGNPDLWEDILRANKLESADKVLPGMTLRIPAKAISLANKALETSRAAIEKATRNGAAIFAAEMITGAVELRDKALEERKKGDWAACAELARHSGEQAEKALAKSVENQNALAEALVDYARGQVHRRKPPDNLWKSVFPDDILLEGEVVRTLSDSIAEIVLRDSSRLQVKANSQVIIEKMRKNLLEDTEESEITLTKGDVFAMLSGGKRDDRFRFNIPGVDRAKVDSKSFRVGVSEEETRISNYEGQFEIESPDGKTVVLRENQGSVVRDQRPSEPKDLLPAPIPLAPPDGAEVFNAEDTVLRWEAVKGAEKYLLEFSTNTLFSRIVWTEEVRDIQKRFPSVLDSDDFFWRVSAVSSDGLTGPPGSPRLIRVIADKEPPFLVIKSPKDGQLFSEDAVEISGNTEKEVKVVMGKKAVEVGENGDFRFSHRLEEGENLLHIRASDPAGNITEIRRRAIFLRPGKINVFFRSPLYQISPRHFLVNQESFILSGKTYPESAVRITQAGASDGGGGEFSASTVTDKDGQFHFNMRMSASREEFLMEITSRTGEKEEDRFSVEVRKKPPRVRFDEDIPAAVARQELVIEGEAEGETRLTLNGKEMTPEQPAASSQQPAASSQQPATSDQKPATSDQRPATSDQKPEARSQQTATGPPQFPPTPFRFVLSLEPGNNQLHFTAGDPIGNVSVVRKDIMFDAYPPILRSHSFSKRTAKGGEEITIEVRVEDGTSIKKTAPFKARIGTYVHTGYMIRSGRGKYVGKFRVPGNISGKVTLKQVTLSDYLGNQKEYGF